MDKTKKKGESNCFHCGEPNHWDYKCPQVSEKDRAELSTTKEKVGRVHKKVSEVVEDNRDSYNVIYMLLDHKAKQRKKIQPINIYMDNCSMYNHMYNGEILTDIREGNIWQFGH